MHLTHQMPLNVYVAISYVRACVCARGRHHHHTKQKEAGVSARYREDKQKLNVKKINKRGVCAPPTRTRHTTRTIITHNNNNNNNNNNDGRHQTQLLHRKPPTRKVPPLFSAPADFHLPSTPFPLRPRTYLDATSKRRFTPNHQQQPVSICLLVLCCRWLFMN